MQPLVTEDVVNDSLLLYQLLATKITWRLATLEDTVDIQDFYTMLVEIRENKAFTSLIDEVQNFLSGYPSPQVQKFFSFFLLEMVAPFARASGKSGISV